MPAHVAAEIAGACDPERFDFERLVDEGREVGNLAEPLVRALAGSVGDEAARSCTPRRDEPGHRRHGRDARLPAGARARARRGRRRGGRCCRARERAPRDAHGRPDAPAARGADDVRPQGRRLADRDRRGPPATRADLPGAARGAARRRSRNARGVRRRRHRTARPLRTRARPAGPDGSVAHEQDTRLRSSGLRSPQPPASLRRSRWICCCSHRPRSPRSRKAAGQDGPRRCRRNGTRSARPSLARAPGSRRLTQASSSRRWSRSTSGPRERGRPSGRPSPAHSPSPGERSTRSRARSSHWRSTQCGCDGTSTRPADSSWPSGSPSCWSTDSAGRRRRRSCAEAAAAESFRDALLDDPRVGLGPAELDAALDPSTYLGSAAELVDRALVFYESSRRPSEVDA